MTEWAIERGCTCALRTCQVKQPDRSNLKTPHFTAKNGSLSESLNGLKMS